MDNQNYIDIFASGRLCLFGEHSDWAGTNRLFNSEIIPGRAIVTGTQQGIYAKACKAESFSVVSEIEEYKDESFECPMDLEQLRETAHKGGYFSYVAGVASYMCERYSVGGVHIVITQMDLPMKKGLSSSAAICVLVARAFNELYDLHLNTIGLMDIAYWGEQRTPSRCGRLDQACAFGVHPVAMEFDGNDIRVNRLTVKNTLYYVFADLLSSKDTIKILADLNSAYPFARDEKERNVHEALGQINSSIISRAIKLIESGNTQALGELMDEAQCVFDLKVAPMCPEQLKAPVLHSLLQDSYIRTLVYGGKGVGSQGDGTIQFLAKDEECQKKLQDYLQNELGKPAYPLTILPQNKVRKAIIPVAGYGTRLFPETRFVKKEFCPVVDKDGLVKPILFVLLEELDSIGIEEICLIISPEEKKLYDELLMKPVSADLYAKLPEKMKAYEDKINRLVQKITLVIQNQPLGFGHAVYQAVSFVNNEPALLLLGDTIYKSNTGKPCTQQLLDAFERYDKPMVALQTVPVETVENYGLFSGNWIDDNETVLDCSIVAEKPAMDYAKKYMSLQRNNLDDQYMAAFGAYVLTSAVFDKLRQSIINNNLNAKGEIEFTTALKEIAEETGLLGFLVNGKSYDLGNAEAYRNTIANYPLKDSLEADN